MTPELWRQIETLYHSARERSPDQRGAFLAQACQGDEELRRKVALLLAQDSAGEKILDRPDAYLSPDSTATHLGPGAKLGPYQIEGVLGAGGMGEVYRAVDTRLERKVAIKICAQQFSHRFEREARAISALNHPHICTLHDVGPNYLVMELVQGDTLAARLRNGALPMDQALRYGVEIADALSEAHSKGIIHRDLKPANVMLTKNGVKVLDFGLAKSEADEKLTGSRMVMGTPAYMAPEQAEGRHCDARTDIFALGLLLYEMAQGKRPPRDRPAPLDNLPLQFGHVVARCLAADPANRWQSAADVKAELEWAAEGRHQTPGPKWPKWIWAVAAAAVLLSSIGGWAVAHFRGSHVETRVLKFSEMPPAKTKFNESSVPTISPDGRHVAFVVKAPDGRDRIWIRDLDSLVAYGVPGSEDSALEGAFPFWSPDSRFLGYFAGGKLKKIEVAGGPAVALCGAPSARGGSWSKDGVIVFAPDTAGGIFRVAASGGSVTAVTALNHSSSEVAHVFPWFLPDGRHFLYTAMSNDVNNSGVYIGDIESKNDSGNQRRIVSTVSNAVYVPGYLLFLRDRTLIAQPFDAGKTITTGDAVPIAEQVNYWSDSYSLVGKFSSSQDGVLAYTSGSDQGNLQLTWFDRSGRVLGTVGAPGFLQRPAISPDGKTVVVDRRDPQTGFYDLWLHNLERGTASRLTFDSQTNEYAAWSPDGSRIAFSSSRDVGPGLNVYQKPTNGASQDEVLDKAPKNKIVVDWSRDGRYIIEVVLDAKTKRDIWVLPLFGDRKPFPFLKTVFDERNAKVSPNGQWLAYTSDETKRDEVYVQTFPTAGGKWQISTDGGGYPIWGREGKELFFIGADGKLMAVDVAGGAKFEASVPKPLFDSRLVKLATTWYDVSKDGRFLIPIQIEQPNESVSMVVNWMAGLPKK